MIKALFVVLTIVVAIQGRPGDSKIESNLQKTLTDGQSANIIVKFTEGTTNVLSAIRTKRFSNREQRITALTSALEENAVLSQAKVTKYLGFYPTLSYTSFWITNSILIRNANKDLVNELVKFTEVQEIHEDMRIPQVIPSREGTISTRRANKATEWGILKIQADEANELLRNISTNIPEVRIATINSGVRGTHEALRDNFLGDFGWYDPYLKTEQPNDSNGLGTHNMGTMVGKGGIGVYPDAKWMACKGCDSASCTESALLACGQYVTCPTLTDGSGQDCTKAPHLVSSSWGGGSDHTWYNGVIDAWQLAGIVPIYSVGGSGPNCGTIGAPADQPGVIAVGSTTQNDEIAVNSGRGPAGSMIKPDVSAPGVLINSASSSADDAYMTLSGTSMANPHVSGVIAILLAHDSDLSFDRITNLLYTGAETESLVSTGQVCSDDGDDVFPNNVFGHGRVNALRSLQNAILAKSL